MARPVTVFTSITIALATIVGVAPTAIARIEGAQAQAGAEDLANLASIQLFSINNDSLYAPDIAFLTAGPSGYELGHEPGTAIAYMVNGTRTHYVAAERMKSGKFFVTSDTTRRGKVCPTYTSACVSTITSDAELIAAVPTWVQG